MQQLLLRSTKIVEPFKIVKAKYTTFMYVDLMHWLIHKTSQDIGLGPEWKQALQKVYAAVQTMLPFVCFGEPMQLVETKKLYGASRKF